MINSKGEAIYTSAEIAYELGISPPLLYTPLAEGFSVAVGLLTGRSTIQN